MQRTFYVRAIWDAENQVYFSESDIEGLHIETATIDQFEDVMRDAASELIVANHLTIEDYRSQRIADLIPAILWQRPEDAAA
ncbi:MAG: DUF1902 domain-containing protein [Pseudomonadota bacterium]